MLSNFFNRETVTIYTPHNGGYIKTYVHDCIVNTDVELIAKNPGIFPLDTIKIIMPIDGYVDHLNYNGNGWTIKPGPGKTGSFIVRGASGYNINDGTEASIREFERNVKYKKPKIIKFYSLKEAPGLNHLEVIC